MQTVTLTDYDLMSPTVAKVVISYTGKFNKEQLRAAVAEKFDNRAAVVEDSFREIQAGAAVGFLRANLETRVVDEKELRANYRALGSSNIMTSEADDSLWEVRKGQSGMYLARHGHEDLSELVSASIAHNRQDVPKLHRLSIEAAVAGEFVAFVGESGDMDYGFAIAANTEKVQVVSAREGKAVTMDYDVVATIKRAPIPKSFADKMRTAGISREDKKQAIEYWKQLYSYNPAYLKDVISQVNEESIA